MAAGWRVSNLLGSPASGEGDYQPGLAEKDCQFPIYWVPQRVGRGTICMVNGKTELGFQFIGFPSEWGVEDYLPPTALDQGFQFIGFPSEWGAGQLLKTGGVSTCFQFIGFPREWGVPMCRPRADTCSSFQFIGFPSEWGVAPPEGQGTYRQVSNLLGSPASGETVAPSRASRTKHVSNLLGSPASGEVVREEYAELELSSFPIYWVPQRVGRGSPMSGRSAELCFQFIGFPSEWGA